MLGGRIGAPASDTPAPDKSLFAARDSHAPPLEGLSAREMILPPSDLPDGVGVAVERPVREAHVADSYLRMFKGCMCEIGDSVPLAVVSQASVLKSEGFAKLGMKLLRTDKGQASLSSFFNDGAQGAFADVETRMIASPDIGDESHIFELTFSIPDLGRGVGYLGVVRIREVVTLVGIVGLEDVVHDEDLYPLMRLTARRVRGESPAGKQTRPQTIGQSA